MNARENSLVVARSFAAGVFGWTEEIRASEWFSVLLDCALEQGVEEAWALFWSLGERASACRFDDAMIVTRYANEAATCHEMISLGKGVFTNHGLGTRFVHRLDLDEPYNLVEPWEHERSPCDPRWGRPGTQVFRERMGRHLAEVVGNQGPLSLRQEMRRQGFMPGTGCGDCAGSGVTLTSTSVCSCVRRHERSVGEPGSYALSGVEARVRAGYGASDVFLPIGSPASEGV